MSTYYAQPSPYYPPPSPAHLPSGLHDTWEVTVRCDGGRLSLVVARDVWRYDRGSMRVVAQRSATDAAELITRRLGLPLDRATTRPGRPAEYHLIDFI